MTIKLSKLTPVDVRKVWAHEAHGFTPWLLANAEALGEALGIDLELTAAEHRVGDFSLDLLGTDGKGRTVIVENQLQKSDHDHLGKLLTYAGGTDPAVIVWIAPRFNEAHRAAIDWINERTDDDTQFFAVEIAAVKIDDSLPAPLFNVVAKPNGWSKQAHAEKSAALSAKGAAYSAFWAEFFDRIHAKHPGWTNARGRTPDNWVTLPSGRSGHQLNCVFTQAGPRVEYYIDVGDSEANLAEFAKLESRRDLLDAKFGAALAYDRLENRRACRIHYDRAGGDVLATDEHEAYLAWFVEMMERLRAAVLDVRAIADAAS